MRGRVRNVAFLIDLLFFVASCHAASSLSAFKDDLINAFSFSDTASVRRITGQQKDIDTLRTVMYCGGDDLTSPPSCIRYDFQSSALIEAFVVNKEEYEKRGKDGLISKGIIIPESYCIGYSCEHTAELNGVEDWCLLLMNIDPNGATASVQFQYQVCVGNDRRTDLILILSAICVGLVAVALAACIGCCWMMRRRSKAESREMTKKEENAESLNVPFLPPPRMPPNPEVFYSMPPPPPMVSHAPYRHEPLFQVQPPLPISHVPPPPPSSQPSTSSAQEIHVQFPPSEKKTRSKTKSKIRFPI